MLAATTTPQAILTSLPDFLIFEDDLTRRNSIFCNYLVGLGLLGLEAAGGGAEARARALLTSVLADDPSHAGAREILRDVDRGWMF